MKTFKYKITATNKETGTKEVVNQAQSKVTANWIVKTQKQDTHKDYKVE